MISTSVLWVRWWHLPVQRICCSRPRHSMVGLYLAGRPVTWNRHVSVLSIIVTIRDSRWTGHGYMTRALVCPSSIIHRPPFINICQTHTRNYAMPALRRCQGSPPPLRSVVKALLYTEALLRSSECVWCVQYKLWCASTTDAAPTEYIFFRNTYFYYDIKRPMKSTTNWQKPDTTSIQVIFLAGVICIRDFRTVLRNQWRQVVLIFSHFGKWLSLQICTSRFTIMLFTTS